MASRYTFPASRNSGKLWILEENHGVSQLNPASHVYLIRCESPVGRNILVTELISPMSTGYVSSSSSLKSAIQAKWVVSLRYQMASEPILIDARSSLDFYSYNTVAMTGSQFANLIEDFSSLY